MFSHSKILFLVPLLFVISIPTYFFFNFLIIVMSLPDYEGVSEVWQLVSSDMFSLISIPFQGKTVKVGVSSDHVM